MDLHRIFYVNEDPSEEVELCFQDCGFCRKIIYSKKAQKKHKEERSKIYVTCEPCMTEDSFDLKYCNAIGH